MFRISVASGSQINSVPVRITSKPSFIFLDPSETAITELTEAQLVLFSGESFPTAAGLLVAGKMDVVGVYGLSESTGGRYWEVVKLFESESPKNAVFAALVFPAGSLPSGALTVNVE